MNETLVDQVARAVLYEGYILYPYRPSVKNRQRWTFGGIYPEAYSLAQGGTEPCTMQTECLVHGSPRTTLAATVRFLHLIQRRVGELLSPLSEWPESGEVAFRPVEAVEIGGRLHQTWQEATEREVPLGETSLGQPRRVDFAFPAGREVQPLRDPAGQVRGVLERQHQAIEGSVELAAEAVAGGLFRVTIRILNRTPLEDAGRVGRDDALLRSLVSTHTILRVRDGEFVSLLEPPDEWREIAAGCHNVGAWPVLVGEDGARDTMLSSPIILYDYPRVAPESPGDLFDATEIDEILTLRILTLTDDEKRAMAAVDERARLLLERTEALAREQLLGLHGAVRGLRPVAEGDA